MNIVLDTNVLVSGLLSPHGYPAQILNLVLNKRIELVIDARIFAEYTEVLKRPKFKFRGEWINPLLDFIKMESESIIPEPLYIKLQDPSDRMFLEVAKTAQVHYLATGNTKHFPEDPVIVSPKEFMERYRS
jgi:putative PIN family toxin of toxin-antitoxin system